MSKAIREIGKMCKDNNIGRCLEVAVMLYWLIWLRNSDSYYFIYLLIGISGILAFWDNISQSRTYNDKRKWIVIVASGIFSLMTVAANYSLVLNMKLPDAEMTSTNICYKTVVLTMVLAGGFFLAWNIWVYLFDRLENLYFKEYNYTLRPSLIWMISTLVISCIYLIIFFDGYYPGTLSSDSIWQIKQTMENIYSNHHPFAHTVVIKILMAVGKRLFDDITMAVAFYSVCQILFMAAAFAYVIVTLYQMKIARKWLIVCLMWYALMPYHIMYSFTMWKDVPFGGLVVVFMVAVVRVLKEVGKYRMLNYALLFVGSMGVCMFRTNGWYAFVLTTVFAIIIYGKKQKALVGICAVSLVASYILLHPVLEYLDVAQPDAIEALSIPAQQIARAITDCNDLTQEQTEMLNKIVNTEEIAEVYLSYISDPVKNKVREKGNQDYLVEHKWEYAKLWMEIGVSHIQEYFEAWADLTKGYWNGGYDVPIWSSGVSKNEFGIVSSVKSEDKQGIFNYYLWMFKQVPFLQVFVSIGLFSWIAMGVCVVGMIFKRRDILLLSLFLLAIVLSLVIATPVHSELRYAYALFTGMPILLFAVFVRQK